MPQKMTLEQRIERLEAVHEIENLMGRHAWYLHYNTQKDIVDLFAKHTPGVTSEVTSHGVFEGNEGIKKQWLGLLSKVEYPLPPDAPAGEQERRDKRVGRLTIHQLTTPVIEVAEDCKTAKAVWMSPGIAASRDAKGELHAYWMFNKRKVDFVKEDGKWKIWHYFSGTRFRAKYEDGWVKDANKEFYTGPTSWRIERRKEFPSDAPTTHHQMYDPNRTIEMFPLPPEPYETYEGD